MGLKKLEICTSWSMLIWVIVVLSLQHSVKCQDVGDYNEIDNPAVLPLITQFLYSRMSNLTEVISRDISNRSTFCIKDPDADWNQAFNFSSNLDFLTKCIQKIEGDITRRLCTVAEMKFYSNNFFQPSSIENYLKPNKNCNLTSWVSGCEPGWACSIGLNQPVDLENSREIPARTRSCQACCEGSHGLTCMTPCLLGSHCPLSRLNRTTGVWEPYNYQLPPGQPNHTCGEKTYGLMLAVVVTYSVQQGQDHTVRQQSRKNLAVVDIIAGWDLHLRQPASS